MKRKITVGSLLVLLFLFSCQIKTVEDIAGKWKYQKDENNWYLLEIGMPDTCSLTVYKDGQADEPIPGKCVLGENQSLFLSFEELGKYKEFLVKKGIKQLILINVNNTEEEMFFSADKGGE